MAFGSVRFVPGVNTVATPTLNQVGISASNLIRFREGLPEKMGGWRRYVPNSMGSTTRALHAWEDLNSNSWLGVASLSSLKVINGGVIEDITPQEKITNVALNLSVAAGSKNVTIVDTAISNLSAFSAIYFNTPVTLGGITLSGLYPVNGAGVGTSYVITAGKPATSTVASGGALPVFDSTLNSAVITVTFANHGLSDGKSFYLPIAVNVGGLSLTGSYDVDGTTTNTFTINADGQATSTQTVTMNGGQVQYRYLIGLGPDTTTAVGGLGAIGEFALGEGHTTLITATSQTGTKITATDWKLDNWGEIILSNPKGGAIYYWTPDSGLITALPVGTGPAFNNGIFVAMPQQILVAYGSAKTLRAGNLDSSSDRLLMRWSNAEDFTNWGVSFLTLAGSFHLGTGSKVVGAIQAANSAFIFTDIDMYTMSFVDYPLVFRFNQAATNCGLVGPHAVTSMRGIVYWMSSGNFHYTSGSSGAQSIPCTVWDNVFQDLSSANASKVVAAANSDFNEIIFFFPSISGGTGENDKYAKYNVVDRVWDYGTLGRSAWVDRSVLGAAIGADPSTTLLQQHETGYSNDGSAMDSFFETGYVAVGEGEEFAVVDQFHPDMKWATVSSTATNSSITVTLTAVDFPNGNSMTNSLTMTSTTSYVSPRIRGRQMKWKVETNDATSWWRMGNVRYRFGVGGRR